MRRFSHHVWLYHVTAARIYASRVSFLFPYYELYIFVDDIIQHYACTTTTFRVGDAFALFIAEYFTAGFGARTVKEARET